MHKLVPIMRNAGEGDKQRFSGGGLHIWKLLAEDTGGFYARTCGITTVALGGPAFGWDATPDRHAAARMASLCDLIMCCTIAISAAAVMPSISTPFTASSGPSSLRLRLMTISP